MFGAEILADMSRHQFPPIVALPRTANLLQLCRAAATRRWRLPHMRCSLPPASFCNSPNEMYTGVILALQAFSVLPRGRHPTDKHYFIGAGASRRGRNPAARHLRALAKVRQRGRGVVSNRFVLVPFRVVG